MLNAIGLQNIGVERFVNEWRRAYRRRRRVRREHLRPHDRGVRGGGPKALRGPALAAIELNASCPNVKEGGSPSVRTRGAVRSHPAGGVPPRGSRCGKALPNVSDIGRDRAGGRGGGGGRGDPHQTPSWGWRWTADAPSILSNVTGGLSGPAVKPVALRMVWEACRR